MFPSEMVILMAVAVNKDEGKNLLTRPMDVTGEYITCLYASLVRRDYIKKSMFGGYQLTAKGMEALQEFLKENEARAKDTIKRLQQLGIECTRKMDELVKGAVGVK